MVLLYIILIALGVFLLILAGYAVIVLVAFLAQAYQLATGKTTFAELAEKGRDVKARQPKKPRRGAFHFLSYPSPLNNWGLWN